MTFYKNIIRRTKINSPRVYVGAGLYFVAMLLVCANPRMLLVRISVTVLGISALFVMGVFNKNKSCAVDGFNWSLAPGYWLASSLCFIVIAVGCFDKPVRPLAYAAVLVEVAVSLCGRYVAQKRYTHQIA